MKLLIALACAALLQSTVAMADAGQGSPAAEVLRQYPAPEARQGVAVDAQYVYAVSNWTIAKYDKRSGERVAIWEGDKAQFPHINSCTVITLETAQLVCANSNFPSVPQWSSVEFFDPVKLQHVRSVPLGRAAARLLGLSDVTAHGGPLLPTTTARAEKRRAITGTQC